MKDMIEVLNIFLKYVEDVEFPFHCEHDILYFGIEIDPEDIEEEDVKRLDELGVFYREEYDGWVSFRFGSC